MPRPGASSVSPRNRRMTCGHPAPSLTKDKSLKIFIAGLATETNTFAPLPTGRSAFLADYSRRDGTRAPPALSNIGLKAWRELAEADGHEVWGKPFDLRPARRDDPAERLRGAAGYAA